MIDSDLLVKMEGLENVLALSYFQKKKMYCNLPVLLEVGKGDLCVSQTKIGHRMCLFK